MKEQKDWEDFYLLSGLKITQEHKTIARFVSDNSVNSCDLIDIGCGNGEYSICLSKYFQVTALDISSKLINQLEDNIQSFPFSIDTIAVDYTSYAIKHDVSFLSFSPVIQTIDDLKRVISLSKRMVFILTVDQGSIDYHRFELIKKFPPRKKLGFIKNADWIRHELNKLEITYKEKFYSTSSIEKINKDDALTYFISYFEAIGYSKNEVEEYIKNYLDNNCVNNILVEKHILNKVLIYFSVSDHFHL